MSNAQPLILTPTARLARKVTREQALAQKNAGVTAWYTIPVLAFPAWVQQLRDDYFLDADDARTPISSDQALELWRSVVDADVFIGEPRIADLAERAWRTLHDYQLPMPEQWPDLLMNADQQHFRAWTQRYLARCQKERQVDEVCWSSELPDLILSGAIEPPAALNLIGFDLPTTPLQARILDACEQMGTHIDRGSKSKSKSKSKPEHDAKPSQPLVCLASDESSELVAAARWARNLLERRPNAQIAIVVHDLQGRVEQAETALRRVFDPPGFELQPGHSEAWHISLGKPLKRWPLVADALMLLGLKPQRLSQLELARWLRSPFIQGWPQESLARADTAARLARFAPHELTLFEFTREISARSPRLLKTLQKWRKEHANAPERALPSAWTAQFQNELSTIGFAHGRPLDSPEHQLLARWQNLLESFSALDIVQQQPIGRSAALRLLNERAQRLIFRERNAGVPLEVLGLQEALGSDFDALWITGMDSHKWPPPAQRQPLIPGKIQQAVPNATSSGRLSQAQDEIGLLLASAQETVFSFCSSSDQEATLSPLLQPFNAQAYLPETAFCRPAAKMERLADEHQAPALAPGDYSGGTGLFQKQSDCPFRAFAEIRLKAKPIPATRPGLDAGTRGSLVHKTLEALWRELTDSNHLRLIEPTALQALISQSIDQALNHQFSRYQLSISRAGRELEKQRLSQLMSDWLMLEKQRPEFEVMAREQGIALEFGGVHVKGTIDRIDRISSASSSGPARLLLIDYKTGAQAKSSQWLPQERMREVQLPAYALALKTAPEGIAFAKLRAGKVEFDGIVDDGSNDGSNDDTDHSSDTSSDAKAEPINGIKIIGQINKNHALNEIESWPGLLERWHEQLEHLGLQFLNGDSQVNPRDRQTCSYCHLHALCRIHERAGMAAAPDDEQPDE